MPSFLDQQFLEQSPEILLAQLQANLDSIPKLTAQEFLAKQNQGYTLLDVRSPCEYAQGHIPYAVNIPLFSDLERARIGKVYADKGELFASKLALEILQPQLKEKCKLWQALGHDLKRNLEQTSPLLIYCSRGNLRSNSVAWLLNHLNLSCYTLQGGYKSYRAYLRQNLTKFRQLQLIGGFSGSGKTAILNYLASYVPVIDLEALAGHKGSVLGQIGIQPTTEQFENNLFAKLSQFDTEQSIFLEDESQRIGLVRIPFEFFQFFDSSPLWQINLAENLRLKRILYEYQNLDSQIIQSGLFQLRKRLGLEKYQFCLQLLENDDKEQLATILLSYYDKCYAHHLNKRSGTIIQINCNSDKHQANPEKIAKLILEKYNNLNTISKS